MCFTMCFHFIPGNQNFLSLHLHRVYQYYARYAIEWEERFRFDSSHFYCVSANFSIYDVYCSRSLFLYQFAIGKWEHLFTFSLIALLLSLSKQTFHLTSTPQSIPLIFASFFSCTCFFSSSSLSNSCWKMNDSIVHLAKFYHFANNTVTYWRGLMDPTPTMARDCFWMQCNQILIWYECVWCVCNILRVLIWLELTQYHYIYLNVFSD